MDNYKYILKCINDNSVLTKEFSADLDLDELKMELMFFLRGCSWTDKQTAFLEEDPEEAIRSSIMAEQYDRMAEFIKDARREELNSDEILDKLEREYL